MNARLAGVNMEHSPKSRSWLGLRTLLAWQIELYHYVLVQATVHPGGTYDSSGRAIVINADINPYVPCAPSSLNRHRVFLDRLISRHNAWHVLGQGQRRQRSDQDQQQPQS